MANWKALTWSESIKTGKQTARHVLTVLCLKCDDDYRIFSDATRIAGFCELSPRRLYDWRDYLEERGFITVIRRVRPNGSEAKPITLLNAPDAPHLNGMPVVLDYHGKHLYPRHPHELHATGIQWISHGEQGRVHPSHSPLQADSSSGCQHDSSSGCSTCTETDPSQATQHDSSSGCQHDNSSPHGGDDSSAPKHSPSETSPTNQAVPDEAAAEVLEGSGDEWLVGEENQEEKQNGFEPEPDTAGLVLLRSLGITGQPLTDWTSTVDAGLARLGERQVRETLLSGREQPGTGAIIKTRLPQLAGKVNAAPATRGGSQPAPRLWCGDCAPVKRTQPDGIRKPTCAADCSNALNPTEPAPSGSSDEAMPTAAEAAEFMTRLAAVN